MYVGYPTCLATYGIDTTDNLNLFARDSGGICNCICICMMPPVPAPDKASLRSLIVFSSFIPRFNQKRKFSAEVVHLLRGPGRAACVGNIWSYPSHVAVVVLIAGTVCGWPHNSLWKSFCGCCVLHKITIQFGLKKNRKENMIRKGRGNCWERAKGSGWGKDCPWGN